MLCGVSDPLRFLSSGGADWLIAQAAVHEAARVDQERRQAEAEALSKMIGAEVARRIARAFGARKRG